MSELIFRRASQAELEYVRDSWVQSYRERTTVRLVKAMPQKEMTERWSAVVRGLTSDHRKVLVAEHRAALGFVVGWICWEDAARGCPTVLHYIHVRRPEQRSGVADDLLAAAGIDRHNPHPVWYSHRTSCSDCIRVPESWEFRPWLVIGV